MGNEDDAEGIFSSLLPFSFFSSPPPSLRHQRTSKSKCSDAGLYRPLLHLLSVSFYPPPSLLFTPPPSLSFLPSFSLPSTLPLLLPLTCSPLLQHTSKKGKKMRRRELANTNTPNTSVMTKMTAVMTNSLTAHYKKMVEISFYGYFLL